MNYLKNILRILDPQLKRKYFLVCFSSSLIAILEIIGISIFFPLIIIFLDKEKLYDFVNNYTFFSFINNLQYEYFLIFSFCFLVFFFIFKSIIVIIINYYKSRTFFYLISQISQKVFKTYLNQSLSFYVKSNSTQITRNILDHPNNYVHHALTGVYNIFFESILIFGIVILLFKINPLISVLIFFLLLFFLICFFLFNNRSFKEYAFSLNSRYTERLRLIRETIDGIKEINLYDKSDIYEKNFIDHSNRISSLTSSFALKDILPRNLIEPMAVLIVTAVVSFLLIDGKNATEIMPIIAVIGACFLKIGPSIAKILSGLQRLRQSEPYVKDLNIIFDNYNSMESNKNVIFSFSDKIIFKNVGFLYDKKYIFKKINFQIKKNTIFGIQGPSGSGKTTLINLLLGFLKPNYGKILVDNVSIFKNLRNWQSKIGYVPQKVFIIEGTLQDNIAFGIKQKDIDFDHIKKVFTIAKLHKSFKDLNVKLGELGNRISAGQIQRIGIARALYAKPKLLILDEATNNLDNETQDQILTEILELKKNLTIIIISHDYSIQKICDNFYNLKNEYKH
jgi:ABC-type multidrug transport system fused ATPase/permease subunit